MPKVTKSINAGHAAHTQNATERSLPGNFSRKIKVTLIGAGSTFVPRLINDILKTPGQKGGTFALVDTDEKRLKLTARFARKLAKIHDERKWKVQASTNLKEVLTDSDYVISCIEVSGAACVETDNDIPLKYGVDQCIGDTIGPGGLFKALRTIPAWVNILETIEKLAPEAHVLNYTNPMAMMCTAASKVTALPVVGLCHSVQGTSNLLAKRAGVPYSEMEWECAGINHLAWFTKLRHNGKDLYPALKEDFKKQINLSLKELEEGSIPQEWLHTYSGMSPKNIPEHHLDLVRKHMCIQFGAFITESSGHLSEYIPWYRKSHSGQKYLRSGYDGGSRFYATNWPSWRKNQDQTRRDILNGKEKMDWDRSWEYASWIIEAREKNSPFRIHGNVMNQPRQGSGQLINNLPADQCVEVACLCDGNGVQPIRYGSLPIQMAAISSLNLNMFSAAAEAAVTLNKELAIQALMLDPLTAAVCSTDEIRSMAEEMFDAQKIYLPNYS